MAKEWKSLKHKDDTAERRTRVRERVDEALLEMDLRAMRELLGKTQQEVAELLEKSQGQVSTTERRNDHLMSTLRRYVEALGGELEIVANFGDKRIRLRGA